MGEQDEMLTERLLAYRQGTVPGANAVMTSTVSQDVAAWAYPLFGPILPSCAKL